MVLSSLLSPTSARAASPPPRIPAGLAYLRAHGYLPIHGAKVLADAKAYAARWAAQRHPVTVSPTSPHDPTIGSSWAGISQSNVTPPDPNGAIGPSSYIEIINLKIAIYTRAGVSVASATLTQLTGHGSLSDPMVLWDADTQRFYYNVWDVSQSTMAWGFSKDSNPLTIPASFCNYTASFGYNPSSDIPDYPHLGQTKGFLMIGVNHYPSFSSMHADRSDLLWINKPQGSAPISTCPPGSDFKSGKFTNLKNQDGTQGFTPVPAIQTDPSSKGYVVTESDIECPDICGTGTLITVHGFGPSPGNPGVPTLQTKGFSIPVPAFQPPADAPQQGTINTLDTLDGRLEHAVSGFDPRFNQLAIWTAHAVLGGAGSEVRWYEIRPEGLLPTLAQSGKVTDSSLYVFNGAMSPDRTCTLSGCAHGSAMVMGFSTSSSTTFPAAQMVSKVGAGAQSGFVMVHQSATFDNDFSCNNHTQGCRWGDYGGATPDPAADMQAPNGEVWLTNEAVTSGQNTTWNWEAIP
jgi:hypothetical protein